MISQFLRNRVNWLSLSMILLILINDSCSFRELSSLRGNKSDLVQYINTLVGTQSSNELSNGNTYPAVAVPWGMNFWTPQTGSKNDPFIYTYNNRTIQGFRCTHQPGPWMGDYGAFNIMPMTDELIIDGNNRASAYSHSEEIAKPHYYQVKLQRYNINAELAPTTRGAIMQFTFPENDAAYIVFDALPGGSFLKILPQQRRILGFVKNHRGNVPKNFACYFIAEFDKDFLSYSMWNNETIQALRKEIQTEGHGGVALRFATLRNETIQVKISTSFISVKQAILNFNREVAPYNFDQVRTRANQIWNDEMNRIKLEGASPDQSINFYTAFYRTLLFPRIFYEIDEQGKMVHYSPYDTQVHDGYMFADIGFWDGFRSLFPLYTILYPERHGQLMQWLVNTYNEGAWLPVWPSPGYRKVMVGNHTAALISDAVAKGITDFDVDLAYEAMKKDAMVIPPTYAPGRDGLKAYNDKGYVPYPDYKEATSKTLEYAYDDFCILQMAKKLNQVDDIELFRQKAQNYKNVFDPQVNFMRGRRADGNWYEPFDPIEWGGPFTEGNAWHYNWSVFHDIDGLINLMGGKDFFVRKLDSVFTTPAEFKVGTYGRVIHEMAEMAMTGMGQYAHCNQPVQHAPYLYCYAGQPWKTQKWIREIMERLYQPTPDGLAGDEDNGAMSSWYILSALGFYPVCPGEPSYILGAPLFRKATIELQNGNQFVIEAPENGEESFYVESVEINGNRISRNWIRHDEISNGGRIFFEMDNKPNRKRGIEDDDRPYSLSRSDF